MSSTNFVDYSPATPIVAAWLNDVNKTVYTAVGDGVNAPSTPSAVRTNLGLTASSGSSLIGYTQGSTGSVSRTVASKLQELVSVLDFGAIGDGVTDDHAAFQSALSSGKRVIEIPAGTYRLSAGITVPEGVLLIGGGAVGSNASTGTVLLFDLAVATCLTLGGATASNGGVGATGLAVVRATGTPPAGSIGVLVQNVYNPLINDVHSYGHAVCWEFKAGDQVGIATSPMQISSGYATDSHIVMDTWPELRLVNSRFGVNGAGDVNCNSYIRVQGGSTINAATGPNGLFLTNCQFNQGQNSVTSCIALANQLTGSISDTMETSISNCHFEAYSGSVISSDATWTTLKRIKISNSHFNINAPFLNLNAATTLNDWQISNNFIAGSVTIAPTAQFNSVQFLGNRIYGGMSITGVSNSTIVLDGNIYGGNLTLAGSFGQYTVLGEQFTSGSFSNTATGAACINFPERNAQGSWTPVLTIGGVSTGITYSVQQGAYQLNGNVVTAEFRITLTSKGTATGVLAITGLPYTSSNNGWAQGGGGVSPYVTGMSALTPPLLLSVGQNQNGITLYQGNAAGIVGITDTSLTNTSDISGVVTYMI